MKEELVQCIFDLVLFNRKRDLMAYLGRKCRDETCEMKVSPIGLDHVNEIKGLADRGVLHKNVYFQACDLYIREQVEPVQQVLNKWMSGAKAQVNGVDIEFSNIISWCQGQGKKALRNILERETRSLCRFLSPFSQATWNKTFETVEKDLGYQGYIDFLREKKGREVLERLISICQNFLTETSSTYVKLVDDWFSILPEPVGPGDRSRFDAIYLLGLRYLDHLYPDAWKGEEGVERVMEFLAPFLSGARGLRVHIGKGTRGQSCCLPLKIPGEIHVITGGLSGWIDLEALFHEMGHAFFFLKNDPKMDVAIKDFYQDFALGETFAFIFQLISMDRDFLLRIMGIDQEHAGLISTLQALKFLTLARRYGTKSIIEYENFLHLENPSASQQRYARLMKKHTGFRYHAETYYFDLMPDLYSLDYFQAFLGAWILRDFLRNEYGEQWFLGHEAIGHLKRWSFQGNKLHLYSFFKTHTGLDLGHEGFGSALLQIPFPSSLSVKKMAQRV